MSIKKFVLIILGVVLLFIGASFGLTRGTNVDWKAQPGSSLIVRSCHLWGGEMKNTGCGIAGCASACKFPYRDGGKACQASKDCSGKCVVTSPQIPQPEYKQPVPSELRNCKVGQDKQFDCADQNFQTQCQTWSLSNCEGAWEYNDGIVRFLFDQCAI